MKNWKLIVVVFFSVIIAFNAGLMCAVRILKYENRIKQQKAREKEQIQVTATAQVEQEPLPFDANDVPEFKKIVTEDDAKEAAKEGILMFLDGCGEGGERKYDPCILGTSRLEEATKHLTNEVQYPQFIYFYILIYNDQYVVGVSITKRGRLVYKIRDLDVTTPEEVETFYGTTGFCEYLQYLHDTQTKK